MTDPPTNPPYFDGLCERLAKGDRATREAFGRHVHWGYWTDPSTATPSPAEYGAAAEALCRRVCDTAGIGDGRRVVDVGCGFGGTLASLNERFSGSRLVGVNIDARQLRRAAALLNPRSGNSIDLVQADATRIPLGDRSFDVVVAVECVFHFNRRSFFSEAERLLDDGGQLTLTDFVPQEETLAYLDAVDLSADEAVRFSYGEIDLSYSLNRYRELAAASGLKLSEAHDINGNTLPTYDFLSSLAARVPDARERGWFTRATRWLEKACRRGLIRYHILKFSRL